MRALIYLLVLGNLLLFVLASGWFSGSPAEPAETAKGVLSPDRIRIVSRGEPPPVITPPTPPSPVACLEWTEVSRAQADRIAQASEASGVLLSRQESVAETTAWWVNIPPSPTRKAGADKKAAELKKLGIRKFSINQEEGPNQYALSFGVYSSEQEAQALVGRLRQKGVRSARMTPQVAGEARERVVLHGPADRLAGFRSVLPESEAKSCEVSTGVDAATSESERLKAQEPPPGTLNPGPDVPASGNHVADAAKELPASDASRKP